MPETVPPGSSDSAYSDFSSSFSSQRPSSSSRASTVVRHAAKSVAGAFVACFVPLNYDLISQISCDSHHTRPASVSSTNGSSHGGRDGPRHSTHTREEPENKTFIMGQIHRAIMNFSPSLKIGQGGFGTIYKGTLDDGTLVAIKRAKKIIESNCEKLFAASGLQFVPLPVMHGEDYIALGFLFGQKYKVAYVSDVSRFLPATEFAISKTGGGQVDLLILDTLYKNGSHNTHFCFPQTLEAVKQICPKRALLIGMTHTFDHDRDNAFLNEWYGREGIPVQLAQDGLRIAADL